MLDDFFSKKTVVSTDILVAPAVHDNSLAAGREEATVVSTVK